jgi:hypothetical protein
MSIAEKIIEPQITVSPEDDGRITAGCLSTNVVWLLNVAGAAVAQTIVLIYTTGMRDRFGWLFHG